MEYELISNKVVQSNCFIARVSIYIFNYFFNYNNNLNKNRPKNLSRFFKVYQINL